VGGAEGSNFLRHRAFKAVKLDLAWRCPSLLDGARHGCARFEGCGLQ